MDCEIKHTFPLQCYIACVFRTYGFQNEDNGSINKTAIVTYYTKLYALEFTNFAAVFLSSLDKCEDYLKNNTNLYKKKVGEDNPQCDSSFPAVLYGCAVINTIRVRISSIVLIAMCTIMKYITIWLHAYYIHITALSSEYLGKM